MRKPLPILLSIPHGGTVIPKEIKSHLIINKKDLFDDSDSYTREIFDVDSLVCHVIKMDIMRAIVDVNRATSQMPPQFPDGLLKSETCFKKPIYRDKKLDDSLVKLLIDKFYTPYHHSLKKWCATGECSIGLDCHSMLAFAPPTSADMGKRRPLINIGNVYGKSCSDDVALKLVDSFQRVFNLDRQDIILNEPFTGGFITQNYGHNPIPWLQIEINRSLYLDAKWYNDNTQTVNQFRLLELNKLFKQVLLYFANLISEK